MYIKRIVTFYVGARYYIAPSFAIAAELGGGIHTSILKVGVSYRF